MTAMSPTDRWRERPVSAALVKTVVYAVPLVMSTGAAIGVALLLPTARSWPAIVGLWLLLCAVSWVLLSVASRFTRRLLPLAALLRLSLVFPGPAPSRYRIARSVSTLRQAEEAVAAARTDERLTDRDIAVETVLRLVAALSHHDRATRGHAERVRIFTDMIAEELGLPEADVDRLRWASLLHDVGKIYVHVDTLNSPDALTEDEWELIREHPARGARLTAPLHDWLGDWALAIEQHHEQWDGSGYPQGLAGRQISRAARIVAVADAFDVMTSSRSYRRAMSAADARTELADHSAGQFDQDMVKAFLSVGLRRVWWTIGPFAWVSNLAIAMPARRLAELLPAGGFLPVGVASKTAVVAGVGLASLGVSGTNVPDITDTPTATTEESDPTPCPSPSIASSPSPSTSASVSASPTSTVSPSPTTSPSPTSTTTTSPSPTANTTTSPSPTTTTSPSTSPSPIATTTTSPSPTVAASTATTSATPLDCVSASPSPTPSATSPTQVEPTSSPTGG